MHRKFIFNSQQKKLHTKIINIPNVAPVVVSGKTDDLIDVLAVFAAELFKVKMTILLLRV